MAWPCLTESLMRALGHSPALPSIQVPDQDQTKPSVSWLIDSTCDVTNVKTSQCGKSSSVGPEISVEVKEIDEKYDVMSEKDENCDEKTRGNEIKEDQEVKKEH